MSLAMLKDPNHTITENGVHCSNSDCVLPMCINSKLGNLIKKSTDRKRAENSKATTDTSLKNAADCKMNSVAANGDMEQWWRDLQSLGILDQFPSNTHTDRPFLYEQNDSSPSQLGAILRPCFSQGIRVLGNQTQPCIQQVHPGSSTVPNLPFFGDGLYQDTQTVVTNPLIQSGIAKHETDPLNDSDASRSAKSGKLFEILSLIFQALEGPHTANLEEHYTSALQKALHEIQAVKSLCHH